MKKSTKRKLEALHYIAASMAGVHSELFRTRALLNKSNELREQHHAQDVALYERSIACSEEITRYAERQTLVAEYALNNRLNAPTTSTEG